MDGWCVCVGFIFRLELPVCQRCQPVQNTILPAHTTYTRSYDELFLAEMLLVASSLSLYHHSFTLFQSFAIHQTSLCIHKSHFRMVYVLKIETVWLSSISMPRSLSFAFPLTPLKLHYCTNKWTIDVNEWVSEWANINTFLDHIYSIVSIPSIDMLA